MDAPQPESKPQAKPIDLRVVCGHLAFARYPVVVGHYNGDAFAGSELRLDQALAGRLTQRRRMGLYPGPIGSNTVVLNADARPPGAVVIGLGEPASLSIGALRRALRQGVLAFAADWLDNSPPLTSGDGGQTPLRLSPLLIGAGDGGLDQTSCIQALLSALREARAILNKMKLPARLAEIEIVELYADRAAAALRAVTRTLDSDSALNGMFNVDAEVKSGRYGRRSAPVEADMSWWQPIQITMSGEGRRERSLSFTIGGGFARAEARTVAADLDLVAPLVRRISRTKADDGSPASPGRALFELLWPPSLKDQSADERNRRLILDERSASFPWELLDDRRPWTQDIQGDDSPDAPDPAAAAVDGSTGLRPAAVRAGMVRQLLQTRFREEILAPRGKPKALVVGNPSGGAIEGMADLKAAGQEAEAIAKQLRTESYDVSLFGRDHRPEEICRTLFSEAWEIIHMSAHGVLKQPVAGSDGVKRTMTGIVLGQGVVLSPSALAKLPISPGIVFVNCCYLGNVGFDAGEKGEEDEALEGRLSNRPEFAASVAVELIKLGARCVIAAGWAVDDKAAAAFGQTFYAEMLNHQTFGDATLAARRTAYNDPRRLNTWGAFQCYGDPDYRLRAISAGEGNTFDTAAFVSIAEAVEAARRVSDDLNIGLERDADAQSLEALRKGLQDIDKEATIKRPAKWSASAELRTALAEAWAEFGDLGKAIGHYKAAVASPDASFKVKAFEQLANLSVRRAVADLRAVAPDKRDPARTADEIRTWLRKIEGLTALLGQTRERLVLQGGCWKRLAQVQPTGGDTAGVLAKMAECYDRAAEIAEIKDKPYPRIMACSARICASFRTGTPCDAGVEAELEALIDAKPPDDADFWDLIQRADARMTKAILRSPIPDDAQQSLQTVYERAWGHIGSPVKLNSVIEQMEFYEDFFSADGDGDAKGRTIVALAKSLRSALMKSCFGGRTPP